MYLQQTLDAMGTRWYGILFHGSRMAEGSSSCLNIGTMSR